MFDECSLDPSLNFVVKDLLKPVFVLVIMDKSLDSGTPKLFNL